MYIKPVFPVAELVRGTFQTHACLMVVVNLISVGVPAVSVSPVKSFEAPMAICRAWLADTFTFVLLF